MTPVKIAFNMCLPYEFKHRKKWVVASCKVLDIHSQGETEEQALQNLKEALQLFIVSCFERGTLEQVLHECGFVASHEMVQEEIHCKNYIDIPLNLLNYSPNSKHLSPCPG